MSSLSEPYLRGMLMQNQQRLARKLSLFMIHNGFNNYIFRDAGFNDLRHMVDFLSVYGRVFTTPSTWATRAKKKKKKKKKNPFFPFLPFRKKKKKNIKSLLSVFTPSRKNNYNSNSCFSLKIIPSSLADLTIH